MPYPTSPARFLAPVALLAAVLATFLVARTARTVSPPASSPDQPAKVRHAAAGGKSRTYIVKPGDTLSAIASKTGVPLSQIEAINDGVDATALHAGQKIKLAR